jgi:hypothetical protein
MGDLLKLIKRLSRFCDHYKSFNKEEFLDLIRWFTFELSISERYLTDITEKIRQLRKPNPDAIAKELNRVRERHTELRKKSAYAPQSKHDIKTDESGDEFSAYNDHEPLGKFDRVPTKNFELNQVPSPSLTFGNGDSPTSLASKGFKNSIQGLKIRDSNLNGGKDQALAMFNEVSKSREQSPLQARSGLTREIKVNIPLLESEGHLPHQPVTDTMKKLADSELQKSIIKLTSDKNLKYTFC